MNAYIIPGLKHKGSLSKTFMAEEIMAVVAEHYRLDLYQLSSKSRRREVLVPRQVAIHLIRYNTKLTLKEIGKLFMGKREKPLDHTTIIHSCKLINDLLCTDPQISEDMNLIKRML